MNRVSLTLFGMAVAGICCGVWLIFPAAALIVAGVLLAVLGVLILDVDHRGKP